MIGSMDGLSAHRHVGRSLLLAAFALGLATTLAIAQQSQQVPKTAPRAATKGAPVPGAVGPLPPPQRVLRAATANGLRFARPVKTLATSRFASSVTRDLILILDWLW